jgi:hypothetical protein
MESMKSRDIKVLIIAALICLAVNPLIILIDTIVHFNSSKLGIPLTEYFIYGYAPLAVSGIYIAFTESNRRILISILVGIIYGLSGIFFEYFLSNHHYRVSEYYDSNTMFKLIAHIDQFLLYILLISGACSITMNIKKS